MSGPFSLVHQVSRPRLHQQVRHIVGADAVAAHAPVPGRAGPDVPLVRPSTLTSQSSRAAAAARSPASPTSSVWIPRTAAMAPGESRVSGAPA
jgi:hypothetical protein